jgi:hypothetical protein
MAKPPTQYVIHISKKMYKTDQSQLTGAQLRVLAEPDIGSDRSLWLEVPGPDDDDEIEDDEVVEIRNGMHFYTSPRNINPG